MEGDFTAVLSNRRDTDLTACKPHIKFYAPLPVSASVWQSVVSLYHAQKWHHGCHRTFCEKAVKVSRRVAGLDKSCCDLPSGGRIPLERLRCHSQVLLWKERTPSGQSECSITVWIQCEPGLGSSILFLWGFDWITFSMMILLRFSQTFCKTWL